MKPSACNLVNITFYGRWFMAEKQKAILWRLLLNKKYFTYTLQRVVWNISLDTNQFHYAEIKHHYLLSHFRDIGSSVKLFQLTVLDNCFGSRISKISNRFSLLFPDIPQIELVHLCITKHGSFHHTRTITNHSNSFHP